MPLRSGFRLGGQRVNGAADHLSRPNRPGGTGGAARSSPATTAPSSRRAGFTSSRAESLSSSLVAPSRPIAAPSRPVTLCRSLGTANYWRNTWLEDRGGPFDPIGLLGLCPVAVRAVTVMGSGHQDVWPYGASLAGPGRAGRRGPGCCSTTARSWPAPTSSGRAQNGLGRHSVCLRVEHRGAGRPRIIEFFLQRHPAPATSAAKEIAISSASPSTASSAASSPGPTQAPTSASPSAGTVPAEGCGTATWLPA